MEFKPLRFNERVAFIRGTNSKKHICFFLGYGIYLGKQTPTIKEINNIKRKDKKLIANKMNKADKFLLDDGNIYWAWDGYFISIERFKKLFINDYYKEGWRIINVDNKGRWRKK
jgi:ribosome biogenesis GTPase A